MEEKTDGRKSDHIVNSLDELYSTLKGTEDILDGAVERLLGPAPIADQPVKPNDSSSFVSRVQFLLESSHAVAERLRTTAHKIDRDL